MSEGIKVMVTVTVHRNGEWEQERTLSLASLTREEAVIRAAWLNEFPRHLDRALGKKPDPEPDSDEVADIVDATPMDLWT